MLKPTVELDIEVFNDEDFEVPFSRWKRDQDTKTAEETIQSIAEYVRFTRRKDEFSPKNCKDERGRYIAPACKHLLHPVVGLDDIPNYCPVCDIQVRLSFFDKFNKAWDDAGGPWRSDDKTATNRQIGQNWRKFRLEFENFLKLLEKDADMEADWEAMQPHGTKLKASMTMSATHALRLARAKFQYPIAQTPTSESSDAVTVASPLSTPGVAENQKKTVSWVPGLQDAPSRKNNLYAREHSLYEAGKYAAGDELEDTSFYDDQGYNLRQLKVIMDPEHRIVNSSLSATQEMASLATGEHEGIAELHELWPKIKEHLGTQLLEQKNKFWKKMRGKLRSDEFLIVGLTKNGNIRYAKPYRIPQTETDPVADTDPVDAGVWTSQLASLPADYLRNIDMLMNDYIEPVDSASFEDNIEETAAVEEAAQTAPEAVEEAQQALVQDAMDVDDFADVSTQSEPSEVWDHAEQVDDASFGDESGEAALVDMAKQVTPEAQKEAQEAPTHDAMDVDPQEAPTHRLWITAQQNLINHLEMLGENPDFTTGSPASIAWDRSHHTLMLHLTRSGAFPGLLTEAEKAKVIEHALQAIQQRGDDRDLGRFLDLYGRIAAAEEESGIREKRTEK
jgi:hypothetical protein